VRTALESDFGDVWIEGEISNLRSPGSGHLYCTLKDDSSQIRAVIFRSTALRLRFNLEDGLHLVARGKMTVYEPRGEYQVVLDYVEPKGRGALQLAFEQLKQRLTAEGLFDPHRKRPLPIFPRTIGIVTSLSGAAVRDIITVLRRRCPIMRIIIAPVQVQGDGSAKQIADAIRALNEVGHVDVIIVGRGGGSLEDLWSFNEETVVRAIVASHTPVISAVGHEVDVTIADFAADVRAPTPSAAAEIVVARKEDFCTHIERLGGRLNGAVRGSISRLDSRVHQLNRRPGFAGWSARLALRGRHCAETTHALRHAARAGIAKRLRRYQNLRLQLEQFDLRRRLGGVRARLVGVDGTLRAAVQHRRHHAEKRLHSCAARLDNLSPLAVLGRGYAVVWDETRTRVIRRADEVKPGDRIRATLAEGEIRARIED